MRLKPLFSRIFTTFAVLILFILGIPGDAQAGIEKNKTFTIAMCRPKISQIKNIEQLLEKDIITFDRIHLVGIFHESESDRYKHVKKYVRKHGLSWVEFKVLKGKVKPADYFKENLWTDQFKKIVETTDGIIFPGGWDFPPSIYNEDPILMSDVRTPIRHTYEVSFLFHLLGGSRNPQFVPLLETKKDYTVLGICLGCQTMNVACGGSLYQDIPQQVYNLNTPGEVLKLGKDAIHSSRYLEALNPLDKKLGPAFHRIKFVKESLFTNIMKMKMSDTPYVLTSHHQAIKKLGKDLEVIATSMDGKIVEGIGHLKYKNVLGIQFHPEVYALYMKNKFYQEAPGKKRNFNLRKFLLGNPPTMDFHKKIWTWFCSSIENEATK